MWYIFLLVLQCVRMPLPSLHPGALVAFNGGTNVGRGCCRTLFLEFNFFHRASPLNGARGPISTLFLGPEFVFSANDTR